MIRCGRVVVNTSRRTGKEISSSAKGELPARSPGLQCPGFMGPTVGGFESLEGLRTEGTGWRRVGERWVYHGLKTIMNGVELSLGA